MKVCAPVQVGAMVWSMGAAESEVMNVAAVPLTAVRPTFADGLALLPTVPAWLHIPLVNAVSSAS